MLTLFQKKVYKILQKIPKGKVTTYKSLAAGIGNPKAYRAVGNAIRKNPKLKTIPCHRVVKEDGSIGGYILGKKKKISFLKKEGIKIFKNKVGEEYILRSVCRTRLHKPRQE